MQIKDLANAFAGKYFPEFSPIVAIVLSFSAGLLAGVQPYVSLVFNESSAFIAKAVDNYGSKTPDEFRNSLRNEINSKTKQFNIYIIEKSEAECFNALIQLQGGEGQCLAAQ